MSTQTYPRKERHSVDVASLIERAGGEKGWGGMVWEWVTVRERGDGEGEG